MAIGPTWRRIDNNGLLDGYYNTITANGAGFEGAGTYDTGGGVDPVTLRNSTVFGNQPDNCYPIGWGCGCFF